MNFDAIAEWQHGVFSYQQARRAGHPAVQIKRFIGLGDWIELPGQVLCLAGTRLTGDARDFAAWLGAGRSGAASGPSAAHRHGWKVQGPRPCVTLPTTMRGFRLPGVRLLFDDLPDCDLDVVDGMVVTTPHRTVIDCLVLLPYREASAVLDRALQQLWIDWESFCARVRARTGKRGTPQLVRLLREAARGSRFEAERRLVALLRRARIGGWEANVIVADQRGPIGEVDLIFPSYRLAVEVDGRAWHSATDRFQRDRTKQNRLVAAGWVVLRFTWEDITRRPDYVIATIRRMLDRISA